MANRSKQGRELGTPQEADINKAASELSIPREVVDANLSSLKELDARYGSRKVRQILTNRKLEVTGATTLSRLLEGTSTHYRRDLVGYTLPGLVSAAQGTGLAVDEAYLRRSGDYLSELVDLMPPGQKKQFVGCHSPSFFHGIKKLGLQPDRELFEGVYALLFFRICLNLIYPANAVNMLRIPIIAPSSGITKNPAVTSMSLSSRASASA